jgi:hypothetical protein
LAPGACKAYDDAVAQQQHLQDSNAAELQAQLDAYSSSSSSSAWGQQQDWQQQQQRQGLQVLDVVVVDKTEGVLGLVSELPFCDEHDGLHCSNLITASTDWL